MKGSRLEARYSQSQPGNFPKQARLVVDLDEESPGRHLTSALQGWLFPIAFGLADRTPFAFVSRSSRPTGILVVPTPENAADDERRNREATMMMNQREWNLGP
jgi:hypothetical protein